MGKFEDVLREAMANGKLTMGEALAVMVAVNWCADFTEEEAANNGFGSAWVADLKNLTFRD